MSDLLIILAEAAQSDQPQGAAPLLTWAPFIFIGFIIYFLMIRPQSKERKKRAEMISAVKKNDRVVTIGGIIGTVAMVKDNEVTLKVDESNNTKITFTKSAISQVTGSEGGE